MSRESKSTKPKSLSKKHREKRPVRARLRRSKVVRLKCASAADAFRIAYHAVPAVEDAVAIVDLEIAVRKHADRRVHVRKRARKLAVLKFEETYLEKTVPKAVARAVPK